MTRVLLDHHFSERMFQPLPPSAKRDEDGLALLGTFINAAGVVQAAFGLAGKEAAGLVGYPLLDGAIINRFLTEESLIKKLRPGEDAHEADPRATREPYVPSIHADALRAVRNRQRALPKPGV